MCHEEEVVKVLANCCCLHRLDASSEGASVAEHDGTVPAELVGVASKDKVQEKEEGGDASGEGQSVATMTKPSAVHSSKVYTSTLHQIVVLKETNLKSKFMFHGLLVKSHSVTWAPNCLRSSRGSWIS